MSKKIIVIGAGPGGYVAAIRAAQLGNEVIVIDKTSNPGGTCLNYGCIPSKNLLHASFEYHKSKHELKTIGININGVSVDYEMLQSQKNTVIQELGNGIKFLFKKHGVNFINGEAKIIKPGVVQVNNNTLNADHIIIATGSIPKSLPIAPYDNELIISSTEALNISHPPKEIIIIGGGYIGLEIGSIWNRFGSKVTVIEAFEKIAPSLDFELGAALFKELKNQGMEFYLNTSITKLIKSKKSIELEITNLEGVKKLTADKVMVSIGRIPNTQNLNLENLGVKTNSKGYIEVNNHFQTSCPGIYAIGDVITGPMLAHKAELEGKILAENLSGILSSIDYNVIPSVVYTQPEVASVGFTEQELESNGIPYSTSKFNFAANGRSKAVHETKGFVKVIAHKESHLILGAHIIGSCAGTLIAELALALSKRMKVEDIANVCYAHPTHNETIKEAAYHFNF